MKKKIHILNPNKEIIDDKGGEGFFAKTFCGIPNDSSKLKSSLITTQCVNDATCLTCIKLAFKYLYPDHVLGRKS